MLERTFCHVPGIGITAERALWAQGCSSWSEYLASPRSFSVGSASRETVKRVLERSVESLASGEHQYFAARLGIKHAWRAFPHFRDRCFYLDIETDGGNSANAVTIIGLYNGQTFYGLVKGESLENFRNLISEVSMIVTFHGAGFDVPVLQKRFKDAALDQIHFDLCPALRQVNVRGGLKKIEREMGIIRPEEIANLTGYDAVKLWRRYIALGEDDALRILLNYNQADCVNLERLAEIAYQRLYASTVGLQEQLF
ncbi:MAG: ribonuclease H-like domain-containing protein [Fimbriimonas sp.]